MTQAGKLREKDGHPALYELPPISLDFFEDYGRIIQDVLSDRDILELSRSQWHLLRDQVLLQNQAFQAWINQHDQELSKDALITGDAAILVDMFMSAMKIFKPSRSVLEAINRVIKDWKQAQLQVGGSNQESQVAQLSKLFYALQDVKIEAQIHYIENPRPEEIRSRLQPPKFETDAIYTDFHTALPGTEIQPRDIHLITLRDIADGRELTVHLAHQKGYGKSDWMGADLIYLCDTNRSIVVVQYKGQSDKGSISFSGDTSQAQMQIMLETCQLQDPCRNCDEQTGSLRNSADMRLQDCPVFYKITDANPSLDGATNLAEGVLIPACLLRQLQLENKNRLKGKDLTRSLTISTFAELLRKSQIGSRASAYERLISRMDAHLRQPMSVSAVAVER